MATETQTSAPAGGRLSRKRGQGFAAGLKWLVSRLRPPRSIRPTRAGYGFIIMTLSVGFASLNTGNNLLYLILGMMLSLIGVSGVLSEFSMRGLSAARLFPADLTVGQDADVVLVLHNHKRFLPALGIWVEERGLRQVHAEPGYFVYTPSRGKAQVKVRYRFERRGKHRPELLVISTTYPFGLFLRFYLCHVTNEVLVYPQITNVEIRQDVSSASLGETPIRHKGSGDDFFGLRTFVTGDDPRRIHWKTSAKRGRLLLRENVAQQRYRVLIKLELTNPLPEEGAYERGLVQVVSYAAAFIEQAYQVAIDIPGTSLPFEADAAQLRRILRVVALAPRAGEAAEIPPSAIRWPHGRRVMVRVAGREMMVEETG